MFLDGPRCRQYQPSTPATDIWPGEGERTDEISEPELRTIYIQL